MRVLVTGAKGFVGRNLCLALSRMEGVDVLRYDIGNTPEELAEWAGTCDFVFHLAGVNRPKEETEFMTGNLGFTETLLAQGKHKNLYFYAFTATPKPKTLQTFGVLVEKGRTTEEDKYRAFHIYSMLQAIEEGFIKDVLLQYTPYSVTYEIEKRISQDPTYEETPATKAVKAYHDNHQHVINQKTEIIVEKFRQITLNAMNG